MGCCPKALLFCGRSGRPKVRPYGVQGIIEGGDRHSRKRPRNDRNDGVRGRNGRMPNGHPYGVRKGSFGGVEILRNGRKQLEIFVIISEIMLDK